MRLARPTRIDWKWEKQSRFMEIYELFEGRHGLWNEMVGWFDSITTRTRNTIWGERRAPDTQPCCYMLELLLCMGVLLWGNILYPCYMNVCECVCVCSFELIYYLCEDVLGGQYMCDKGWIGRCDLVWYGWMVCVPNVVTRPGTVVFLLSEG